MKIEITERANLLTLEGKFDLGYLRKRIDYQKLLGKLDEGAKLDQIFKSISISQSIKERMKKISDETHSLGDGLIDSNEKLTPLGRAKLKEPYFYEKESGIYTIDVLNFKDKWLITKIDRKITSEDVKLEKVKIPIVVRDNEFKLDNEIVKICSLENSGISSKIFQYSSNEEAKLIINLGSKTYSYGNVTLKLGDELTREYNRVLANITSSTIYGQFDVVNYKFLVDENCIDNYSLEDLFNRRVTKYESQNNYIMISDCEFVIVSKNAAVKYAYLYAFELLEKPSSYYSFTELNNIFKNEILDSSIYLEDIKIEMANFEYTKEGFKNCNFKKYQNLEYKLRIQEWLLNINMLETKEFREAKDYKDIVTNFSTLVPGETVESVYIVMGYAFTKDSKSLKNKIVDFFSELKRFYNNIYILDKCQNKDNKNSDNVINKVTNDLGIKCIKAPKLKEYFHDRFIIFKLKDGFYKSYLITCEIGQYFGDETSRGSIFEYNEGISKKVKLIDLVEREVK